MSATVTEVLEATAFIDIHTHLFPPAFDDLGLWGIDDLLTYHYLEAEFFRFSSTRPDEYWALSKREKADAIWRTLFVENAPLSEATRGVIAVLDALKLETNATTLAPMRDFFRGLTADDYVSCVFRMAGISAAVMTNDPLDSAEAAIWKRGEKADPRFQAALRLDRLVTEASDRYLRRLLMEWSAIMQPVYMAISLPDSFQFPAEDCLTRVLRGSILPACRELEIPLALM